MIYQNNHPHSEISEIQLHDRTITIRHKNGKIEAFEEHNLDHLLNFITGRTSNNHRFLIDKDLEQSIYQKFMHIIWKLQDRYIYTGNDSRNHPSHQRHLKMRQQLIENFIEAPKRIALVSSNYTIDEQHRTWQLGFSPMKIQLSSQKINSSNDQQRLNQAMRQAAILVNNSPNFNYPRVEDGVEAFTGRLSEDFVRTDRFKFELHKGTNPSKAIRSLFRPLAQPFIIECTIAIQLMEYKAILEFVGDQQFDRIFFKMGIILSRTSEANPILLARDQLNNQWQELAEDQEKFREKLVIGDILYIRNIKPYLLRHAFGESNGHNVVYLGKNANGQQEFAGLFTIKKIRTYEEIIDLLIADYNEHPHYIIEEEDKIRCIKPGLGGVC